MPVTSHQTVRLQRGSHNSPESGVCVMELSSMLAGEPFSDRPASVCPVIAQLLRTYNDGVDDVRRQKLYACAALVVGSKVDADAERRRAQRLREFVTGGCRRRSTVGRVLFGPLMPDATPRDCGTFAAQALLREPDRGLSGLLALVPELVGIGAEGGAAPGTAVHPAARELAPGEAER
jgi:hypothetical protein